MKVAGALIPMMASARLQTAALTPLAVHMEKTRQEEYTVFLLTCPDLTSMTLVKNLNCWIHPAATPRVDAIRMSAILVSFVYSIYHLLHFVLKKWSW